MSPCLSKYKNAVVVVIIAVVVVAITGTISVTGTIVCRESTNYQHNTRLQSAFREETK